MRVYRKTRSAFLMLLLIMMTAPRSMAVEPVIADTLMPAPDEALHQVSILVCTPSQSTPYTIYGHAAIRVRSLTDETRDFVYNYGVFDFNQPGFYYKFIKGETDGYMVQTEPWDYFLNRYLSMGQDVRELVLSLSPRQINDIRAYLDWNIKDENKYYLYNFALDNCATRPFEIIESTLPRDNALILPESTSDKSLRTLINSYAGHYPWYRTGTDIALGMPADTALTVRDRIFLPMEMDEILQHTLLNTPEGSRPVVSDRVVYEAPGAQGAEEAACRISPALLLSLLLIVSIVLSACRRTRYWTLFWMSVYAIAGGVVFFLSFLSIHPYTAPNITLLVFHPLLLLCWFDLGRATWMHRTAYLTHCANIVLIAVFLICTACGVQVSSLPIVLLALHSAVLSVAYIRTRSQR